MLFGYPKLCVFQGEAQIDEDCGFCVADPGKRLSALDYFVH